MIGTVRRNLLLTILPALWCLLVFAMTAAAQAPAQKTGKLIVKITGIRNAEGNIRIAVRTDESTIAAAQIATIDPKSLTAEAVFDNLPEGDYGVAVIHDENKNEKLDFNDYGMPTEGYGHSNNPSKRQGPPDFNETKFVFSAPTTTITINLIYWP
ncbi:DUF2141 domain-containing protein [Occallatibacter savannae]|uniref:DUF2141 domain-containing protein n=1 Tax=Occallatibacter savannae TaxID=1002691 RepID=UPI000D695AE9|nr:DUF2141 domain-containing protein [Occallatibacter savannae]